MPQCSVPGCTKQGGHKFRLSNKPLLDKWIVAIKREEHGKKGRLWKRPKTRVCHEHFDAIDYKTTNYYGKYHYRCSELCYKLILKVNEYLSMTPNNFVLNGHH